MAAYYNEIDPFAAQWLRELINAGAIAPGDVDERDIADVTADDLAGYDQCHFFAGIGVWSYALRLAGWPDDRPVWTGSCPCQPFSSAGSFGGLDNANGQRCYGQHALLRPKKARRNEAGVSQTARAGAVDRSSSTDGVWRDADWVYCRDGKWRPVEPGTCPLAARTPSDLGRLRGYGNAINAVQAQAFIEAVMEIKQKEEMCG